MEDIRLVIDKAFKYVQQAQNSVACSLGIAARFISLEICVTGYSTDS